MVNESGSAKTVEASSNLTPCFAALDAAFLSFHSKVSGIQADHHHWCCSVPRSSSFHIHPVAFFGALSVFLST